MSEVAAKRARAYTRIAVDHVLVALARVDVRKSETNCAITHLEQGVPRLGLVEKVDVGAVYEGTDRKRGEIHRAISAGVELNAVVGYAVEILVCL